MPEPQAAGVWHVIPPRRDLPMPRIKSRVSEYQVAPRLTISPLVRFRRPQLRQLPGEVRFQDAKASLDVFGLRQIATREE